MFCKWRYLEYIHNRIIIFIRHKDDSVINITFHYTWGNISLKRNNSLIKNDTLFLPRYFSHLLTYLIIRNHNALRYLHLAFLPIILRYLNTGFSTKLRTRKRQLYLKAFACNSDNILIDSMCGGLVEDR